MPNLSNYPFRTAKTVDGQTYISVDELNEILDSLEKLGPTLQQVAAATSQLKQVFGQVNQDSKNLLVELNEAQRKVKDISGITGNSEGK